MTRDEKAKEELEWRRVNEEIELRSEGIEPCLDSLSDYAIDTTGLILAPITYACLQLFPENKIASNYSILSNQIFYYIIFAFLIIPFTFVCDTFLHNANELLHGWKIYDYLSYQRYRFSVREYRWMLRNPVEIHFCLCICIALLALIRNRSLSQVMDESISEEFQTVDLLCFSSQFYFLMGLLSYAMVLICMSIEAFLRLGYNPLGDMAFLILFVAVFIVGYVCVNRCYHFNCASII